MIATGIGQVVKGFAATRPYGRGGSAGVADDGVRRLVGTPPGDVHGLVGTPPNDVRGLVGREVWGCRSGMGWRAGGEAGQGSLSGARFGDRGTAEDLHAQRKYEFVPVLNPRLRICGGTSDIPVATMRLRSWLAEEVWAGHVAGGEDEDWEDWERYEGYCCAGGSETGRHR